MFFFFVRFLISKISINVMILTVCVLSIERYVAICHPFLGSKCYSSSKSRAIKTMIGIWLLELLGNILFIFYIIVVKEREDTDVIICVHTKKICTYVYGLESFISFFVPMTLVFILHILIIIQLRKSVKEMKSNNEISNYSKERAPKILSKYTFLFYFIFSKK